MKPEMDSTNREMSQKVKLHFAVHHASRMKIREREWYGGDIKTYEQSDIITYSYYISFLNAK